MPAEFYWIIALTLLALCVGFLIPLLVQLRKTARRTEIILSETQADLIPLLRDLREATEKAARLARAAEEDVSRLSPLFKSLGEAGSSLHALTGSINSDLCRYAGSAIGFWLGMRSMKKSFPSGESASKGG